MWRMVLCGAAVAALAGCGNSESGAAAEHAPDTPAAVQVTYEADFNAPEVFRSIHGATFNDGAVDVTYTTRSGVSQQSGIAAPIVTRNGPGIRAHVPAGSPVVFLVQNGKDYGTVTCRIRASDGSVLAESSSTGGYVIARCEGAAK